MAEPRPNGLRYGQEAEGLRASTGSHSSIRTDDVRPHFRNGTALDRIRRRIEGLVAIAGAHDATMRIVDIMPLLPYRAFPTVDAMERFLREDPEMRVRLTLINGLVVERAKVNLIASHEQAGALVSVRIAVGRAFVDRLASICPWLLVAGLSGSTVYGHAKPDDDLDFFLVVARRRMWVTLFVAFILGRIDRRRIASPIYCFNRTLEDYECDSDFNGYREPLIAREALTMLVLRGETHYASILDTSAWMAAYYPELYEARRTSQSAQSIGESHRRGGFHWGILNGIAFLAVATYLALMGFVRNARLGREGRLEAQFRTVIRKGFCAYESNKYEGLRDTYRRAIR
jgi:hypothetical protein